VSADFCSWRGSLPRAAFALLCLLFLALAGYAAPSTSPIFDATNLREPHALDSTWLVKAGDDPAYARPDYDDSQWTRFDPRTSIEAIYGHQKPPIVWYRLRIKVDPAQSGLALDEANISRAFEIYVNGERLIAVGKVAPFVPYTLGARSLAAIPDRVIAAGTLVIAMRVHIAPVDWGGVDPGYYANNLTLGEYETLYRDNWLTIIGENALDWFSRFAGILLGLVALVLHRSQRGQKEYLWIAAAGLISLVESLQPVVGALHSFPMTWAAASLLPAIVAPYVIAALYFSFVRQRIGWRWTIFLGLTGVLNLAANLQWTLFPAPTWYQLFGNLPMVVLISVILPVVLAIHWRRGNHEAGILLIPITLLSLYVYAQIVLGTLFQFPASRDAALRGINLINRYQVGPFNVSLATLSGVASTASMAVIILLRSVTMSRRQALLEGELAAAQQVQELLLPEHPSDIPGFAVEAVYEPADQVGGDFFLVLPAVEGGLLVVVGDVAGKGLPAAMLVAAIVGSARTAAEESSAPDRLLHKLNDRLVGRTGGGFTTALVAHIRPDGRMIVANAGHLPPYLDGRELYLPGALPLGLTAEPGYETTDLQLGQGSRLTFYSDGVVEAQNQKGELFGFERGCKISTETAAEIAAAAKAFGQRDDITVVTIERVGAAAAAA
jgi:hypothetical protein